MSKKISFLNSIDLKSLLGLAIAIYLLPLLLFRFSTVIQKNLLFMHHVNRYNNRNLSRPEDAGLKSLRKLRVSHKIHPTDGEMSLGVWHVVPESHLELSGADMIEDKEEDVVFADSRPIILYIHGNGGTRANVHRIGMYKRLAYEFDCHVVTFDYRGFADSSYLEPTKSRLVADARLMYDWLLRQPNVTRDRIIVWGHSLGTGIAVQMVSELGAQIQPDKMILESPFDSVANAIANHPFTKPFTMIPFYAFFLIDPIESSSELNFNSLEAVDKIVQTSMMIVHAEDDKIIPCKLGRNLFKRASSSAANRVKYISIDANHGLGHNLIYTHNDTMFKIRDFIYESSNSV